MSFISLARSQGERFAAVTEALSPHLHTPLFQLHSEGCLDPFPEFDDWSFSLVDWAFDPLEWRLLSPLSSDMYILSYSLLRCRKFAVLGRAGGHHSSFFILEVVARQYSSRLVSSFRESLGCRFCNLHMEDIMHLFFLCPCKARDWMILASTFPFLRALILMLLAGEPFPSVLRSALFFPKGLWLFTVVLLSSFLRTIWKQRCTYVYEDSSQVIPLQLTLALLGEKLLGQYIVAGGLEEGFLQLSCERLWRRIGFYRIV
ncbi:hypothetical protein R1sor_011196 [Riccia sorocarpa]|uniref:Reverse transcriptase zinc-binding domain-containing protein n=1 Tax=Riccia sorocarpa TaxID=122646 RepID=A0ABD3I3U5_9MARC